MVEYTASTRIDASPEVVWSVLSEVEAMPTWTPTMSKVAVLSPEALGVGSRVQIDQPKMPARCGRSSGGSRGPGSAG